MMDPEAIARRARDLAAVRDVVGGKQTEAALVKLVETLPYAPEDVWREAVRLVGGEGRVPPRSRFLTLLREAAGNLERARAEHLRRTMRPPEALGDPREVDTEYGEARKQLIDAILRLRLTPSEVADALDALILRFPRHERSLRAQIRTLETSADWREAHAREEAERRHFGSGGGA